MERNTNSRIENILNGAGLDPTGVEIDMSAPLGGTNTSYICADRITGAKYVLRLAAESSGAIGINRRGELAALKAAASVGCGAPLYYFNADSGDMLTGFIEGRMLSPDDFTPENVPAFAEIMKRLHSRKTEFIFDPVADVERRLGVIAANNIPLHSGFGINYAFYRKIADKYRFVPDRFSGLCHGDPFAANFIMKPDKSLTLVDFEFSGTGNIFFDMSCLISSWSDAMRADFWQDYFGDINPEYDLMLRDWDVINVMWNCTWAYLKSLDRVSSYGGDTGFDFVAFGDHHVEILNSIRIGRNGD